MFNYPPDQTSRKRIKTSKSVRWGWPKFVSLDDAEERSPARQRGVSEPNPSSAIEEMESTDTATSSHTPKASFLVQLKSPQTAEAGRQAQVASTGSVAPRESELGNSTKQKGASEPQSNNSSTSESDSEVAQIGSSPQPTKAQFLVQTENAQTPRMKSEPQDARKEVSSPDDSETGSSMTQERPLQSSSDTSSRSERNTTEIEATASSQPAKASLLAQVESPEVSDAKVQSHGEAGEQHGMAIQGKVVDGEIKHHDDQGSMRTVSEHQTKSSSRDDAGDQDPLSEPDAAAAFPSRPDEEKREVTLQAIRITDSNLIIRGSETLREASAIPSIQVQKPTPVPSEIGPKFADSEATSKRAHAPSSRQENTFINNDSRNSANVDLVVVIPRPTISSGDEVRASIKSKRRQRLLRKTRNALNRRTYLKATLGRSLATPVKDVLRRRAKGEDATVVEIQVVS